MHHSLSGNTICLIFFVVTKKAGYEEQEREMRVMRSMALRLLYSAAYIFNDPAHRCATEFA